MSKEPYTGLWFTQTAKEASETFEHGERKKAFPICSSFEDLARIVSKAKESIHWSSFSSCASIRIGPNQKKIVFSLEIMRKASPFFCFFSLPTMSATEAFQEDIERIAHLTEDEVDRFDWMVDWCHIGGSSWRLLRHEFLRVSFDGWGVMWALADVLQMETLQAKIKDSLLHMMIMDKQIPSSRFINYLCKHFPYRDKTTAAWLYDYITHIYATQPADVLIQLPGTFESEFVLDVMDQRKTNNLADSPERAEFNSEQRETKKEVGTLKRWANGACKLSDGKDKTREIHKYPGSIKRWANGDCKVGDGTDENREIEKYPYCDRKRKRRKLRHSNLRTELASFDTH